MKKVFLLLLSLCVTMLVSADPIPLTWDGTSLGGNGTGHRSSDNPWPLQNYPQAEVEGSSLYIDVSNSNAEDGFETFIYNTDGVVIEQIATQEEAIEISNLPSGTYRLEIIVNNTLFFGYFRVE